MKIQYPLLIDGGLSNELEKQGCTLNHKLWTALVLDKDIDKAIQVHLSFLRAGAQCISTLGYQASIQGFLDNGYSHEKAIEFLLKSVEATAIARDMYYAEIFKNTGVLIAASIGPYGAFMADGSEYRGKYGVSKEQLMDFHRERIEVLDKSEADILAFETFPSYAEAEVIAELTQNCKTPAWISFATLNEEQISDGTSIEKCATLFSDHPKIFAVGVNCLPPERVTPLIKKIKTYCKSKKIIVYPNSGDMYDADSKTWKTDEDNQSTLAHLVPEWIESGASIIGGCCRIGPLEIQNIGKVLEQVC